MSRLIINDDDIKKFAREILISPKYRSIDIPTDVIVSLYYQESKNHKRLQDLHKAVRKKLHNIVAPYLGDTDYAHAQSQLIEASHQGEQEFRSVCLKILSNHVSTQERIGFLDNFYQNIFSRIGQPKSILDLACGYHPFALPWMNLNIACQYYAYDIVKARIDLINTFFQILGRPALAFQQDILIHPPDVDAEVAFFFKEAHRFDQRQRGSNRDFWQALKVKHLLVSLPSTSMRMRHDKTEQHRKLVLETIKDFDWSIEEFQIENELFFWIKK